MKPILFAANATTFTSNGLGALDPTSCVVTEEVNGQYELECVVPVESPHFDEIHNNMILVVIPGDGGSVHPVSQRQAFRIYHVTEPMNGLVTLSARHISYDLSYNTVMPPITASSITTAFSAIAANMIEMNRFSFDTDKSTAATFKVTVPQTARQLLGGQSGSILDVYGGEYQWDNWRVCLWNNRGQDTDVTLRYGKNITDISQEENLENVITGIVPYWANEDETLTLPEKSIDSQYASQYPYKRTVPVDFSSDWENKPTVAQLRSRGQSYVNSNRIGIPKVSIKVSFVALWQTDEYKDIAPLERVHLCDTVGVVFEKYGINTRAEVIKTEWDCLTERYLSIELGEPRSNFARTIVDLNEQTTQEIVEAKSDMQKAIDAATEAITGVNGGYIKINSTSDGKPYEILIMDNEDASQAVTVWRYNLAGWGVSTNGINGPYSMAATLNSQYGASINADYIIAGTMVANRVRAGLLTDEHGYNSWNLDTGAFSLSSNTTVGGSTVSSIANSAASSAVNGQTQQFVFNKLTNNQANQGIYLQNGQLYINASMIQSGYISADRIRGGTISSTIFETTETQDIYRRSLKITSGKIDFSTSLGLLGSLYAWGINSFGFQVESGMHFDISTHGGDWRNASFDYDESNINLSVGNSYISITDDTVEIRTYNNYQCLITIDDDINISTGSGKLYYNGREVQTV